MIIAFIALLELVVLTLSREMLRREASFTAIRARRGGDVEVPVRARRVAETPEIGDVYVTYVSARSIQKSKNERGGCVHAEPKRFITAALHTGIRLYYNGTVANSNLP